MTESSITIDLGLATEFRNWFGGKPIKLFGGVDINDDNRNKRLVFKELGSKSLNTHLEQTKVVPVNSNHAHFEINLMKIAQNLRLE